MHTIRHSLLRPLPLAFLTGVGVLPAQTIERFYGYSVEVTQVDSSTTSLFRFNNRGSFLGYDYATSTPRGYLRYANGQRDDFPAGYLIDDLTNLDQVGGLRDTMPSPNHHVSRGWVYDHGVYTEFQPWTFRDPHLVATTAYGLSDSGFCLSQGGYLDANGASVSFSPTFIGLANAANVASQRVPLVGTGAATGVFPHNMYGGGDLNRINQRGNFLLGASMPSGSLEFFVTHVSGLSIQVHLPAGFNPNFLDDRDRVVGILPDPVTGRNGVVWVHPNGQLEIFGQDVLGSFNYPNVHGHLIGQRPSNGMWFHPQQSDILRLHGGAHAALDALVNGWNGIQLLGSRQINDPGQILTTVALPTGERRYAILHPGTTPILALDFRHPRGTGARWNLPREQDGTVPFRIVGGEPGQPTALFVKLGTQYYYVDGTLGVFDSRQMFELRLPVPASLVGLDFDLSTGALDSQFGILRGLDVPITFR